MANLDVQPRSLILRGERATGQLHRHRLELGEADVALHRLDGELIATDAVDLPREFILDGSERAGRGIEAEREFVVFETKRLSGAACDWRGEQ